MRKTSSFIFYVALVASLGGLLFGFDTAVIAGAEKKIQALYELSNLSLGFTVSIGLIGTIIGALFCGRPAERFGRLPCLKVIAYLYMVCALGCALWINWYALLFFRLIGGMAVGASSVVGPMYVAEISPAKWRGRFVAFFQFNIVFGITIAYISNWLIADYLVCNPDTNWQWMLGVMAVPAAVFAILLYTMPESPRWLALKGQAQAALSVIRKTGGADAEAELAEIEASLAGTRGKSVRLFQRKYIKPILIALIIPTFNQFSGINQVLYYANRVLEQAGAPANLLQSLPIWFGVVMVVCTGIAMSIIDKAGRKALLFVGSLGMGVALSCVAACFYFAAPYYLTLTALGIFLMFFCGSQGTVIWVIISEVFPTEVRAKGQTLGSMTHWFWNAALATVFPYVLGIHGGDTFIFAFFACMMFGCFFYVFTLPETRNKSLEQIQRELVR